jgi:hypothetical protein
VAIKRHFDSELFMMTDWINPDDAVKESAMMRLLGLVCGEGACRDTVRRRQVAADFVQKEDRMLAHRSSHITHTGHSKVGAHSLPTLSDSFPTCQWPAVLSKCHRRGR